MGLVHGGRRISCAGYRYEDRFWGALIRTPLTLITYWPMAPNFKYMFGTGSGRRQRSPWTEWGARFRAQPFCPRGSPAGGGPMLRGVDDDDNARETHQHRQGGRRGCWGSSLWTQRGQAERQEAQNRPAGPDFQGKL